MNKLQIFKNEEFGEVRTVTIDNEPWFVGKDVAMALGYQNAFLSSLFSSLLMQHLESVLDGNEEDFMSDAASFAALLTSTQDKVPQ